jgi:hypothetical protein
MKWINTSAPTTGLVIVSALDRREQPFVFELPLSTSETEAELLGCGCVLTYLWPGSWTIEIKNWKKVIIKGKDVREMNGTHNQKLR